MIYGRIIIVNTDYFNKILDFQGVSYFVNVSSQSPRFISIHSSILDRKMFNYSDSLINSQGESLEECGLALNDLLSFTPFVKDNNDRRKNYYKNKKTKFNSYHCPITISFD